MTLTARKRVDTTSESRLPYLVAGRRARTHHAERAYADAGSEFRPAPSDVRRITPDYGLDAPPIVRSLVVFGAVSVAGGIAVRLWLSPGAPIVAAILSSWGFWGGGSLLASAAWMIVGSLAGKRRMCARAIDALALRGGESVLDAGCGRGLFLVTAAHRLPEGRAIGVDIWQAEDQSGNRPAATYANARAEGVADRVDVCTADLRALPLADACCDAVVSSLTVHNIAASAGRARALTEMIRVLKPGGRIVLLDFQGTAEYRNALLAGGLHGVRRSRMSFLMWPPVRIVAGSKPV
jgi:arsenite methyltransferase